MNEINNTSESNNIAPRLIKLEQTIAAGLHTFREVGAALLEIRNDELYKLEFPSFEAYCIAKWKFSRAHAYRMIAAATIATEMSPNGDVTMETHARALAKIPKAKRAAALKQATETAAAEGRPLVAQDIIEVAKPTVTTVIVPPPTVSTEDQLRAYWIKATPHERDSFLKWTKTDIVADVAKDATADETETAQFVCNNCGAEFDDDEGGVSLYECGGCGTVFTQETSANGGHNCPDCNKFGGKISDCGCSECNEGELESTSPETN